MGLPSDRKALDPADRPISFVEEEEVARGVGEGPVSCRRGVFSDPGGGRGAGGEIPDPQYGSKRPCFDFSAPGWKLGAHVAALGMRFYTGKQFPAVYRNQIFIAEHGSWNRSSKVGYRITLVKLEGDKAVSYEPFATGWLKGETAWGRPADVLIAPDGALLISDDHAGAIYRISYSGN